HRAIHHPPLLRQSPGRAGTRRRAGGHRSGRVHRPAAHCRIAGGARMSASVLAPVRNEAGRDVACAVAYASVGNVAVGFDILGHSLAGPGDRAEVRRIESPEVRIAGIHGCVTALPTDPQKNTAGVALLAFHKALGLDYGLELTLHKGIALGSGMGGS